MKPGVRLIVVGLCSGTVSSSAYVPAPERQGVAVRTTVTYFESEKFTDVAESSYGSERERAATLAALKEYLIQQASRLIPANHRLLITVTEIDRAGDFEPWQGPSFDTIRIVKDLYPPRIVLLFRVTNEEGNIVREGKRELRDLTFMTKVPLNRDDPLRCEKELIDGWLRQEFGR
jgi:hypothetical protein